MNNMKSTSQTDREATAFESLSNELQGFAYRMRSVPRKALRCEVYGTVTAVVDTDHALNIFRKVFPGYRVDKNVSYQALAILQNRLDDWA